MTSPMIMAQMPNWSLSTTWQRVCGCWIMGQKNYLSICTLSWLKHRMPSRFKLATSSGTALQKNIYPPPQPSQLNNKYPYVFCLHPSVFWSKVWRNKQYITPDSWIYLVTGYQDWRSDGCPLRKGYATIIEEHYSPSCSAWRCEKRNSHPYSRYEEIIHGDTKSKEGDIGKWWNLHEEPWF